MFSPFIRGGFRSIWTLVWKDTKTGGRKKTGIGFALELIHAHDVLYVLWLPLKRVKKTTVSSADRIINKGYNRGVDVADMGHGVRRMIRGADME